jgi:two-component system, chemotaxis family, chemotaxis protein CheY
MTVSQRQIPRIVVAEDAEYMRDLLALLLRHEGFEVVAVAGGDAALASIVEEGADALVSDLNMPGLDGLTLTRVLRSLRASAALPIVVFTGVEAGDPRLDALREFSALRILSKPMALRDIAPLLHGMLAIPDPGPRTRVGDLAQTSGTSAQSMSAGAP